MAVLSGDHFTTWTSSDDLTSWPNSVEFKLKHLKLQIVERKSTQITVFLCEMLVAVTLSSRRESGFCYSSLVTFTLCLYLVLEVWQE